MDPYCEQYYSEMTISSWLRIKVLAWADKIPYYVLWMLVTYLTSVWKLNFTRAAEVVNLFYGAVAIMPVGMQLIVDAYIGNYWMTLLSSLAYTAGLGLLTVSSPPVLSGATDSCSASQTQCLSQVQKILFYVALPLIALGMAGQITSVEVFADQNSKPSWKMMGINGLVISFIVSALTSICVVLGLGHIKPWWILFGIAAICTLGATLTFLSGSASYKYPKSQESAITTLLRVFVASFSKISKTHPGCDSLYISYSFYQIPYTNRLRCLDKAAIILPASPSIEQQQKRRWRRLCTVTEVEETKKIICMIPIWMNFILIGVVSSIGNTYFVEQANNLNKRYGLKIEGHSRGPFPLLVLLVLQEYARAMLSHLPWEEPCRLSRPFKYLDPSNTRRYAPLLALSMTMASLCCIVAASVERLRLSVVKSHGLLDEPNEGIPMNRAWLLPQFILLGLLNGSKETAFRFLLLGEVPQPGHRYRALAHGVFGVGTISSVLSVYLVGKTKLTWFQETLNRSRLDNYYWTLAALTAANLLFYVSLSFPCWSSHHDPDSVHRPNDIHTDCEVEAEMDIAP